MENMQSTAQQSQMLTLFLVVTTLLTIIGLQTSYQLTDSPTLTHFWAGHLFLELLSIFASVSVVAILFQRPDHYQNPLASTIVFGFTGMALLDFLHALSFEGMPTLISPSSMETSIFFWLAARFMEALTLGAILFHVKLNGHKLIWLLTAVVLVLIVSYIGFFHLDLIPQTFIPGHGVTEFKSKVELLLFFANFSTAMIFSLQFKKSRNWQYLLFACSAYSMALCSLLLTSYESPTDISVAIAHILKIISAIFIYSSLYWTELKRPYIIAKHAENKQRQKEQELDAILKSIPLGISKLDRKFDCLFSNQFIDNLQEFSALFDIEKANNCVKLNEITYLIKQKLNQALRGETIEFDYEFEFEKQLFSREVVLIPERDQDDTIDGVLCFFIDTTERKRAGINEALALRETKILRKALDEHAIVAFTDPKGVITSVNEKFCQISKYSKHELVGQTHRIINSGYHTPDFFRDMWSTITQGSVWHGEVCNKAKDGTLYWVNTTIVPFFNEADRPTQFVAIRADITERKLAEQEAQRLAYYDEVTSLPNRRLFTEKLEKLFQYYQDDAQQKHVLMLIDIDNFKDTNDSYGHNVGDVLLKQIACRLQRLTNSTQFTARFGDDEFVLLFSGGTDSAEVTLFQANELAEEVRQSLGWQYTVGDRTINSSCSIGITLFSGSNSDPSECLKQADIAMYQSKSRGKNQVSLFDPELQRALERRNLVHSQLKTAIEKRELILYFQPIYNSTKQITGTEALLRWNNPLLGFVPPTEFITVAEQSSLILDIGYWVLHEACQQLALWAHQPVMSKWTLAVNVSAKQIQQNNFVSSIEQLLLITGANPCLLKLEITESMLQTNIEETVQMMRRLKGLGVMFSLDDFGTGYSSLNYLSKLPIDTLKIDKSFVDKIINRVEDEAVIKTVLSLARALNLDVVAEGVETETQFDFLSKAGTTYYQGYLLSKPMPAEQLQIQVDICNAN